MHASNRWTVHARNQQQAALQMCTCEHMGCNAIDTLCSTSKAATNPSSLNKSADKNFARLLSQPHGVRLAYQQQIQVDKRCTAVLQALDASCQQLLAKP
jgi:hypothetical protein